MNPTKMKDHRPYWKAKLTKRGKLIVVDVELMTRHGISYTIQKATFAWPKKRCL